MNYFGQLAAMDESFISEPFAQLSQNGSETHSQGPSPFIPHCLVFSLCLIAIFYTSDLISQFVQQFVNEQGSLRSGPRLYPVGNLLNCVFLVTVPGIFTCRRSIHHSPQHSSFIW